MEWTGAEAIALQHAMNKSIASFARMVRVSVGTVEHWRSRRGTVIPREPAQQRLDAILRDATTAQKAEFARQLPTATVVIAQQDSMPPENSDEPGKPERDVSQWIAVDRRQLLALLGGVAMPPAAAALLGLVPNETDRLAGVLANQRRVDAASLDHLDTSLEALVGQTEAFGPRLVLPSVTGQIALAEALLPNCPDALRPRLFSMHAALARLRGWLLFDTHDFTGAAASYRTALTSAHSARDNSLTALVQCNSAYLAAWTGDSRSAIDHAVAAQVWSAKSDDRPLRAYAHSMAGVAHAYDGDRRDTLAALDNADNVLADSTIDDAPSLAYFTGEGLIASFRARCLIELDDHAEAHSAAERALDLIPPDFVRNRALAHLDLAESYAGLREIDAAAASISRSAQLAADCRSDRLTEQVLSTRDKLDRWSDLRSVTDLDAELDAYSLSART